jgi:hypothetical protein
MKLGIHRNNTLMLMLTALSLLCLLFLVLLFLYSGTLFPQTPGASSGEATLMWAVIAVMIGLPVLTGALWLIRLASGSRKLT